MPSMPSGPALRRLIVVAAAITVAAAPALTGLRGNESFAQSVPVSIPSDARVMTPADFELPEHSDDPSPSPSRTKRAQPTPSAEATHREDRPSASPDRKHGRRDHSAEPSPTTSKKASPRPSTKPSRSARPTTAPSPSASVDDHGGNPAAPANPTDQPTSDAPTLVAPTPSATADDHGGNGGHGGGSGKGGGGQ